MGCDFGGTCNIVGGIAKCECDIKCADSNTQVCGSDGKTYPHKCELQKERCAEQKDINVIRNKPCGELGLGWVGLGWAGPGRAVSCRVVPCRVVPCRA